MTPLHKYFLLVLIAFSSTSFAQTSQKQVEPEKRQLILHLLDLTGALKNANSIKDQMLSGMTESNDPERREFATRFREKFDVTKFIDVYVSIYDNHFSKNDLKGLISFYETPLGKKMIAELPAITHDAIEAGGALGENAAKEVQAEMAAEKARKGSAK